MNINGVFNGGAVQRFHTVPGMSKQTVAEHSWGVAILCQELMPDCSKELLLAAMTHDCAEFVTGDIPAPFKWANPDIKDTIHSVEANIEFDWGISFGVGLSEEEHRMLKLCDAFEGMRYCVFRRLAGEQGAERPFGNWRDFVSNNYALSDNEFIIYNDLVFTMEQANGSQ